MMNHYAIEPVTDGVCEHETLFLHDETATIDDLTLMPNAFLESLGECGKPATYRMIITDEYTEAAGEEYDEYTYCTEHAQSMLNAIDPDESL